MDLSVPLRSQVFEMAFCLLLDTNPEGRTHRSSCCLVQITTFFKDNIPTNSRNILKICFTLCANNSLSLARPCVPASLRRAMGPGGEGQIAPTVCRLATAGRLQMNASRNLLDFMTQFPLTTSQINHSFFYPW